MYAQWNQIGQIMPVSMVTPVGAYAVSAVNQQAQKQGKRPLDQEPEPFMEKPEIPKDLLCNICKDLLTDAITMPCCATSFCIQCKYYTLYNFLFCFQYLIINIYT